MSGRKCLAWKKISEMSRGVSHNWKFSEHGGIENAGNSCRNPIGLADGPWCFIAVDPSRSSFIYDYCDIPDCGKVLSEITLF